MVEKSTTQVPTDSPNSPCAEDALNNECVCTSLDQEALENALELELGRPGLFELISQRCPNLFSIRPVFVSAAHRQRMERVIRAIESVVGSSSEYVLKSELKGAKNSGAKAFSPARFKPASSSSR